MNPYQFETRYDSIIKTLVLIGDLVILNLGWWGAMKLGWKGAFLEGIRPILQMHLLVSVCWLACVIKGGFQLHLYKMHKFAAVGLVCRNLILFALLLSFVLLVGGFPMPSFWWYLLFIVYMLAADMAWRMTARWIMRRWAGQSERLKRAVFVGSAHNVVELAENFSKDPLVGFHSEGYFDEEPNPNMPQDCPYLGKTSSVVEYLKGEGGGAVNSVFCCLPSRDKDTILPIIHFCENNLVRFYSVPNVRNYVHQRMHFLMVGNVPCLTMHREPLNWASNRIAKRAFDLVFSGLFLCTLFVPIFIIVTIVTKITMPGPVFFRQKRTGIDGKTFQCIKFRSMKMSSDADTKQATRDDNRITKWGHILRATSLDELPQFINVFKGDMSIVGPRPHMLKHTEQYSHLIDDYFVRHYIKPGITGWSQVTGYRGETKDLEAMEGRVKRDIWYIEHWSFTLDIYIIYKTVVQVFKGDEQAY